MKLAALFGVVVVAVAAVKVWEHRIVDDLFRRRPGRVW